MTGEVIHNTGNPVPSSDAYDREDNTRVLDSLINGTEPTVTGRTGAALKAWMGIEAGFASEFSANETAREQEFQQFLISAGYVWIGDYAAGVQFTARNQYTVRLGSKYRLAPTVALPFTLSGNWAADQPKLVLLEDSGTVLAELAAADGASKVGYGGETVEGALDLAVRKDSATGAILTPSGTTAQRPAAPVAGMQRFNNSTSKFERYVGGKWLNHGDMDGPLNEATISSLDAASASTSYIYNNTISINGTSAITTLGDTTSGVTRRLIFTTSLQITHNAVSLILIGGANIITAPGDVAVFVSLGSGNWKCVDYVRASGAALGVPATITAEFALVVGAVYPVTHPHGVNASVDLVYVCKTANLGYSPGDELEMKDYRYNPDTGLRVWGAYIYGRSTSGFTIGLASGANWTFPTKGTGVPATVTLASWVVKARIKP